MTIILTSIVIILIIIKYLIFIDIILSWLTIVWIWVRPNFIASILDPIYEYIKKRIPTNIWPLDFTPIIIFILVELLIIFIYGLDGQVIQKIKNLSVFLNLQ